MAHDLKKYQGKSITPVDEYVCTLSEELQRKAEDELGETPQVRDRSLREIREWIYNNPRIEKCRMDSKFLLRFLRFHKYIIHRTKESLERYLIFREGLYGYDWFTKMDTERDHLQDLLNRGMFIVLPNRSKTGEKVVMTRMSVCDPDIPLIANTGLTLSTMIMETLFDESEENQIRGFRYVLDVSHIRLKHYFVFSFGTWFRILKHIERTFASRHKGCHIINMSPTLAFIARLAFRNMKEKMRNGIHFHSNAEELYCIDIKNLPKSYGGDYTLEEIVEPYKKAIDERRQLFLDYSNMKINKEYYTEAVLKCDSGTLSYSLENKRGKLLTKYNDDIVDDSNKSKQEEEYDDSFY